MDEGIPSMTKLDTVTARARLATRRSPYWDKIKPNHFLGFRYMTEGSGGSWLARVKDPRGGDVQTPLGKLAEIEPSKQYGTALAMANKWFAELAVAGEVGTVGVLPSRLTLREVLQAYVASQRKKSGERAEREALRRIEVNV